MNRKKKSRLRRVAHTRAKLKALGIERLVVNKTSQHTYAQIIKEGIVLASASTLDKDVRGTVKHGGNKNAASIVGKLIAERAVAKGIKNVGFDRSGFKYHGRVKALADAARDNGLAF